MRLKNLPVAVFPAFLSSPKLPHNMFKSWESFFFSISLICFFPTLKHNHWQLEISKSLYLIGLVINEWNNSLLLKWYTALKLIWEKYFILKNVTRCHLHVIYICLVLGLVLCSTCMSHYSMPPGILLGFPANSLSVTV